MAEEENHKWLSVWKRDNTVHIVGYESACIGRIGDRMVYRYKSMILMHAHDVERGVESDHPALVIKSFAEKDGSIRAPNPIIVFPHDTNQFVTQHIGDSE